MLVSDFPSAAHAPSHDVDGECMRVNPVGTPGYLLGGSVGVEEFQMSRMMCHLPPVLREIFT